ncbi:type IV pilin protein [Hydrogenophaga sp. BPS33]|uniref:type IV pilin protein n=1 Tax=Hydrogenophaga sp. BPS33 TaxID=2651974 RepID=UPI00132047FA|nr:type 4 pilus major pilin [Hydrogenophaga sp. BPS33]QHE89335.1 pilus assembly protein [Hydrogenophaga sp. BPS33]
MKSFKRTTKFKKQAGVTLMELIAGLTVMAIIVGGAMALYQNAMSSQQTTQLTQDLAAVRASVKQIWQGQGSFGASGTNLNSVLVTAKRIPTSIRVDSTTTPPTLTHAGNGNVVVTSAITSFEVTMTNINEDICIPLLTGAQGWLSVSVSGGTPVTSFPVSPPDAVTACAAGTTIAFRGN